MLHCCHRLKSFIKNRIDKIQLITIMDTTIPTNRQPLKFFLLVYGLSIPLWIIETLIDIKGLPLDIPITDILAAFTPLVAASILVYKEEGHIGMNKLFKMIFDFNRITKKRWLMPVILLPSLMYLFIYVIIYFSGLPIASKFHISLLSVPVLFVFFFLGQLQKKLVIWVMLLTLCKNGLVH